MHPMEPILHVVYSLNSWYGDAVKGLCTIVQYPDVLQKAAHFLSPRGAFQIKLHFCLLLNITQKFVPQIFYTSCKGASIFFNGFQNRTTFGLGCMRGL